MGRAADATPALSTRITVLDLRAQPGQLARPLTLPTELVTSIREALNGQGSAGVRVAAVGQAASLLGGRDDEHDLDLAEVSFDGLGDATQDDHFVLALYDAGKHTSHLARLVHLDSTISSLTDRCLRSFSGVSLPLQARLVIQSASHALQIPAERRPGVATGRAVSRATDAPTPMYWPRAPKGGDGDALSEQKRENIAKAAEARVALRKFKITAAAFSLLAGQNRDLVVDAGDTSAHQEAIAVIAEGMHFGLRQLALSKSDVALVDATTELLGLEVDFVLGDAHFQPIAQAAWAFAEQSDLVGVRIDLATALTRAASAERTNDLLSILMRVPATVALTSAGIAAFLPPRAIFPQERLPSDLRAELDAAQVAQRNVEATLRAELQAAVDRLAPLQRGAAEAQVLSMGGQAAAIMDERSRAATEADPTIVLTRKEAQTVQEAVRAYENLVHRLQPVRSRQLAEREDDEDDSFLFGAFEDLGASSMSAVPAASSSDSEQHGPAGTSSATFAAETQPGLGQQQRPALPEIQRLRALLGSRAGTIESALGSKGVPLEDVLLFKPNTLPGILATLAIGPLDQGYLLNAFERLREET